MVVRLALLSTLLLFGCAKGTVDGFDSFNSGNSSPGEGADDPDAMTTSGASEGSDSLISETFTTGMTGASQSGSDSSGGPTTAPITGDGSTTDPGGSSDGVGGSTGGGPSEQPATGMYAHCILDMYDNCTASAPICIHIPQPDGICTQEGCVNPAVDCDPAPGGTAVPFCWTGLDAAGDPTELCGLNCNVAGAVCPGGMTCYQNVAFPGQPSYDLCL